MRHIVCIFTLLLPSILVAQTPQVSKSGAIHGTVVRADTDEPVANVEVRFQTLERPNAGRVSTTTTDELGRFSLKDLAVGSYRLAFARNGYVAKMVGSVEAPLKLEANPATDDLIVELTPTGTISGRLVDRSGRPLGDVPIRLSNAVPIGDVVVRTNDRGEYRFFYVQPGSYSLIAGGTPTPARRSGAANRFPEEFPLTYYPGSLESSRAEFFSLKAGEDRRGMDMVLGESHVPPPRTIATPSSPGSTGTASAPPTVQ